MKGKCLSQECLLKQQDHYEFMQISPNAEPDTIHRVFKFLAARFHPDNTETGDADKFSLLKEANDVLSDPARRAEYDAMHAKETPETVPMSSSMDFMDIGRASGRERGEMSVVAVS